MEIGANEGVRSWDLGLIRESVCCINKVNRGFKGGLMSG